MTIDGTKLESLTNREFWEAALTGLETRRVHVALKIAELRQELAGAAPQKSPVPVKKTKRRFSAAARKRMSLSQKRRWRAIKAAAAEAA